MGECLGCSKLMLSINQWVNQMAIKDSNTKLISVQQNFEKFDESKFDGKFAEIYSSRSTLMRRNV